MNGVDWAPAVAFLAAGLAVGAFVLWRVRRQPGTSPPVAPLELRDLQGKYQALILQLRELDFSASKRLPEQIESERHALEHAAARVLRDVERLSQPAPPPRKPKKGVPEAIAAPRPAPASALKGFLWGVGSVGALGLLFFYVSQSAKQRAPGGSLTGNAPVENAAPSADAELQQAQAAVLRNPDDVDTRLDLVRLYLIRQDLMSVFKETQAVLQRSPDNPRALSYQSLVRLSMGQPQQAESMLKRALATDPQLLDAYIHLMLVYVRTGRQAEADALLAGVAKRFPARAEAVRGLLAEMRSRMRDDSASPGAAGSSEDPHANLPVGGAGPGAGRGSGSAARASGAEKKIAGTLALDASLRGQSFQGAVVFVTLREGGFGAGPPLAAKRLVAGSFPMPFEIGSADSMTGEPLPDDLLVEARIDSDGDPLTRPPSDPYGSADRVPAGSKGVQILLQRRAAR